MNREDVQAVLERLGLISQPKAACRQHGVVNMLANYLAEELRPKAPKEKPPEVVLGLDRLGLDREGAVLSITLGQVFQSMTRTVVQSAFAVINGGNLKITELDEGIIRDKAVVVVSVELPPLQELNELGETINRWGKIVGWGALCSLGKPPGKEVPFRVAVIIPPNN